MESLYLLIPVSVAIVFLIGVVSGGRLGGGQLDDRGGPACGVLMDDDKARAEGDDANVVRKPAPGRDAEGP